MNLVIRATQAADWQDIKATRLAALLDAPTAFGASHAGAAAFTDEDWQRRAVSTPQRTFLLAWAGSQAIGIAAHVVNGDGESSLQAMWVKREYRGMEIAAGLVDAVKQLCIAAGQSRLVLDVSPDNTRAAAFYKKQGFVFLPQWETLDSHPHIQVQKMAWLVS
ncbi:GNAT family N-acetyltransferase [Janthinobacterium sp. RB2R34]|uniref:GNAT family N-acetyltransferase n=1 Tax=Janthinobacterium sp. RB2R34 TaxID=3424193 RepID=UPI003F295330